jgi:hypothetical protein
MYNQVSIIRSLLDQLMIDYDEKSFDKAELYLYRHPNEFNIVFLGTAYDMIEDLLKTFDGFLVYSEGLIYIGTKGQTLCPLEESIVDSLVCDQCKYYRDPWYDCTNYRGV